MSYNEYSNSWNQYKAALQRADQLQNQCEDDNLFVCVIYDTDWKRWIVHCVDTNTWIKESFHGGHRAYCAEVWREDKSGTILYTVPEA